VLKLKLYMTRTARRQLGDLGEDVACDFLKNRGFEIIERNYLRKWGELDIIARKNNIVHFVEVKSVSQETPSIVSQETRYRPEENMHPRKINRLTRAIQTYLMEKRINEDWQLDLVTIKIDKANGKAKVELIANIIM
jgi:putative endonuclease